VIPTNTSRSVVPRTPVPFANDPDGPMVLRYLFAQVRRDGTTTPSAFAAADPGPRGTAYFARSFLPLAWIFGVARFCATGLAFCLVAIATPVIFPADARIGHGVSRHVVASLGCTAVAWLAAMGNLNEALRLITENHAHRH
jgi:hypothetical protein